jgi:hypothetical protein
MLRSEKYKNPKIEVSEYDQIAYLQ